MKISEAKGDLISRQAALEAVGDVHPLDYNGQGIVNRIKALPAERQWIPVSERLPKDGETVYIYAWNCHMVHPDDHYDVARFVRGISKEERKRLLAEGNERGRYYHAEDEDGNNKRPYCWLSGPMTHFGQNVTHWMPKPEPPPMAGSDE